MTNGASTIHEAGARRPEPKANADRRLADRHRWRHTRDCVAGFGAQQRVVGVLLWGDRQGNWLQRQRHERDHCVDRRSGGVLLHVRSINRARRSRSGDGNSHTWSVAIDSTDNRWDNTVGGDVGPCGVPPTTLPPTTVPVTTLPPTTVPVTTLPPTTVPETTLPPTTVPETTLPPTTVPETTLPPTTVPDSSDPTTTDVSPSSEVTTTTLVSDEGGTTTTVSPSGGGQLPRTGGSGIGAQVALAAALMCAGVALLAIGRRRPQQG